MGAGDGARAWAEHAARPAFEDGPPFPVRVQGEADRAALRFAMLAWQDAGAISPFREEAPMLEAELLRGPALGAAPPRGLLTLTVDQFDGSRS